MYVLYTRTVQPVWLKNFLLEVYKYNLNIGPRGQSLHTQSLESFRGLWYNIIKKGKETSNVMFAIRFFNFKANYIHT